MEVVKVAIDMIMDINSNENGINYLMNNDCGFCRSTIESENLLMGSHKLLSNNSVFIVRSQKDFVVRPATVLLALFLV